MEILGIYLAIGLVIAYIPLNQLPLEKSPAEVEVFIIIAIRFVLVNSSVSWVFEPFDLRLYLLAWAELYQEVVHLVVGYPLHVDKAALSLNFD